MNTTRAASRRNFLARSGLVALGLSPLGKLLAAAGSGTAAAQSGAGYGPLKSVRDMATGLPLLRLPAGFSYTTFGWAGEALADGTKCPERHDGMGIVKSEGSRLTLVRNHEVTAFGGAFGAQTPHYDGACSGGTVNLVFDTERAELVDARPSLSGTLTNCAGGVTPWGSWLSCEEIVTRAGTSSIRGSAVSLKRDHGFLFEVPATAPASAVPLRAMGQFRHEAVAAHAASGHFYLTEDLEPKAGFFRFVPSEAGKLEAGGKLQMLRVDTRSDLRSGLRVGESFATSWVDIEQPERGINPQSGAIDGVQIQGFSQGAAMFTRLEGCIASEQEVFFTATNGGDAACGQLFAYRPESGELRLVYESTDPEVLDYPDNIVLSRRGGMVICQDARRATQKLFGLTVGGDVFPFAENNVVLDGARGFSGDFRGAEWAGACFSPDGRWLFANIYFPGMTVAITGPWRDGLI